MVRASDLKRILSNNSVPPFELYYYDASDNVVERRTFMSAMDVLNFAKKVFNGSFRGVDMDANFNTDNEKFVSVVLSKKDKGRIVITFRRKYQKLLTAYLT